MAVEDHGGGAHYVRVRMWPRIARFPVIVAGLLIVLTLLAASDGAQLAATVLAAMGVGVAFWAARECAFAMGLLTKAAETFRRSLDGATGEP
jgi:hypothetical protein